MTSQGTDFDLKLSGHMPILWKRKIRNFIKKYPQNAFEVFFENYKRQKDTNKMKYGLEQLLPTSLNDISTSFANLNRSETLIFLELLSTSKFLTHISSLDREKQESILNHIINNWDSDFNQELIRSILSQIDPNLVEPLYGIISKKPTNSTRDQSLEIMKLWGILILPIILKLYLMSSSEHVKSLFETLNPQQRVQVFQETDRLSKSQLKNLLKLTQPTEEELSFLFASKHYLDKESRNLLLDWYINQNLSHNLILQVYGKNKTENAFSFVVDYFIACIKLDSSSAAEVLVKILSFEEFPVAHEILKTLSSSKYHRPTEILVSVLNKLQEQVPQYSEFFTSELRTHAPRNLKLILKAYFDSKLESHRQLMLPFLQEVAGKNWKVIINTSVETKAFKNSNIVFDIFTTSSKRIKQNIGNYIIKQSLIAPLAFFYSDFEIFQSTLTSSKILSINEQVLLEPYLKQHFQKNFENLARLGKKITTPQSHLSSMMDRSNLETLLDLIRSNKELLQFWEETFLICSNDALQIVLKEFLLKKQKKREYLIPLLNKLVKVELPLFWTYFKTLDQPDVRLLQPILTNAFETSIPAIGEILSQLPELHFNFIIEKILPQFKPLGSKILYSLFSFQDISKIKEQIIQRTILEVIRFDPENLLIIVLIRCSKTFTDPMFSSIIPQLIEKIFSEYPTYCLIIVDTQKLTTLVPAANSFLLSLPLIEVEKILLFVIKTLKSNNLNSVIVDLLVRLSKKDKVAPTLFNSLLTNYEREDFSIEGKRIVHDFVRNWVGESTSNDLMIFTSFKQKPRSQSQFLSTFFAQTSQLTLERILLDSPVDLLEENILKIIINHFESQPPEMPEEYFTTLYAKVKEKEEVQRAVLPLLGEFCSWNNLSMLMELPEKDKYHQEYEKALIKFSSRFDIQSHKALRQIWSAGLKDVYERLKEPNTLLQSQCPQCGNPILENQKNCGFCSQRLTCIICRKSVVRLQIEEEVVQCPQCSSFFHRRHLQESVKLKNVCPVCNVKILEVKSLPTFTLFFK